MAKITNKIDFKNAVINLPEGLIIEDTKDGMFTHKLQDIVTRFEDSKLNISITENTEDLGAE